MLFELTKDVPVTVFFNVLLFDKPNRPLNGEVKFSEIALSESEKLRK